MGKTLSLTSLCLVFALAALEASAEPPKGQNRKEDIEKCDSEQTSCRANCDKTIIDVDDNVDRCKRGCDRDRALCLQHLVGGRAEGARSDATSTTRSPGGDATTQAALVCCYLSRSREYEWRTDTCHGPGWDPRLVTKVHPNRCASAARPRDAVASADPVKICCRYSTPTLTQPAYKWDPVKTCRRGKGTPVPRNKCAAVMR